MSGKTALILLGSALVLFAFGATSNNIGPALIALFMGGAGAGGLVSAALKKPATPKAPLDLEGRFRQMEDRLRLTEDELASANRELAVLKEEREFDRQLYGGTRRSIPPGGSGDETGG